MGGVSTSEPLSWVLRWFKGFPKGLYWPYLNSGDWFLLACPPKSQNVSDAFLWESGERILVPALLLIYSVTKRLNFSRCYFCLLKRNIRWVHADIPPSHFTETNKGLQVNSCGWDKWQKALENGLREGALHSHGRALTTAWWVPGCWCWGLGRRETLPHTISWGLTWK